MSGPNQDTDKRIMQRIKQQSADEHAEYMAKKMRSEKRKTILDENVFLKGRVEELEKDLLVSEATYLAVTNADDLAEFDRLNRRIEELKAHVNTLRELREFDRKKIEELEAQLDWDLAHEANLHYDTLARLYKLEALNQSEINSNHRLIARNLELEATLERVRALPDKWRNRAILQRNSATTSSAADQFDKGESKGTSDCADELEAAIKGEGDA